MRKVGFGNRFCSWIMECILIVTYSVLINREPTTHLFFADDSVLFCKTIAEKVACIRHILKCYEEGSGQYINLEKSFILFSHNCPRRTQQELKTTLGGATVQ